MFDVLPIIGLLVAVALLTASLFIPWLGDKVRWVLRKAVALVIISVVVLALIVLAVQVTLLSVALLAFISIVSLVLWSVLKLLEVSVPWIDKGFTAVFDFGENGLKTIGNEIKAIVKRVWSRW